MKLLANTLILLGAILLAFAGYLIFQRYNPAQLSFHNLDQGSNNSVSGTLPRKIVIPSLKITLPIYPAQIKRNEWQATPNGVSYLAGSPLPGDAGNSILYGHNWANLLGPLPRIKTGEKIEIVYGTGEIKTFIVRYTALVSPTETKILAQTQNEKIITLYTCAGFLDSKRFVATAFLQI